MPTVSTTLKMFDVMSGPMKGIIQSMNLMVSAMSQMQNAANQNTNIDKALTAAKDSLVNAETDLTKAIEQAATAQDNLNKKIGQQPQVKIPKVQQPGAEPAWKSAQNIELFKTTGIDRLKSEMLDAHNMMSKLQANQASISIRANSMDIVSPEAQQDIENAYQRMRSVYNEMGAIARQKNILKGKLDPSEANRLNTAYETLRQELNSALGAQQTLNTAMKQGNLTKINSSYKQLIGSVDSVDKHIRDNISAQNQFNKSVEKGTGSANNLWQKIKGIGAAYLLTQGAKKGAEATDTYISTQARLNNMNYGGQTTEQLQSNIFAAANRARGDYETMASGVSKMGLLARDAFSSNDELISFTELMQKSFKVSGSSTQEQQAGMYQLTQAMASGKLQGDEFRSIMENAPMLADAIAKFTGKSKGELKKMSAEGTITADVIKNAMFKAATDINSKFEKMPMTFSDVATNLKNKALQTFAPVMEKINEALNSPAGQAFVNNISNAISFAAIIAEGLLNTILGIGNAVQQNWGVIEPIILGVAVAMGLYTAALIAYNTVQGISNALKAISVFRETVHAAATMMSTGATFAATAAQYGFNAALLACPLTWIILAVIALIAVIFIVIAIINKAAGTSISATGVIFGAFAALGAFLWNLFLGLLEIVLGVINYLVNPFINFANFIGNVFTNPISSIIYLFQSMADTALAMLQKIASALDFVFGSKMADSVQSWRSGLKSMADDAVKEYAPNENYKKVMDELNLSTEGFGLNRIGYGDAYNAGYGAGKKLQDNLNINGMFKDVLGAKDSIIPTVNKVNEVGKVNGKVDISSEDLKTMRELAEIKNIQNFVKLTPTVKVQTGDIKNGYDVDTIINRITNELETSIASSAEGVYFAT